MNSTTKISLAPRINTELKELKLTTTLLNGETTFLNDFSSKGYDGQSIVSKYLRSGMVIEAKMTTLLDHFTLDTLHMVNLVFTDGEYKWTTEFIYYIDKYNMLPPIEFVNHIAEKGSKNKRLRDALCKEQEKERGRGRTEINKR